MYHCRYLMMHHWQARTPPERLWRKLLALVHY
jgi:hypothetical protein